MVSQLNKAGTLTAADLVPSRKPLEKSDSSALSLLATDNNPPNDDKQREAGRRNDDANERDLGNCGELPRMERYDGDQGEEGGEVGGSQNKSPKSMNICQRRRARRR